jgi:hypothetical protein
MTKKVIHDCPRPRPGSETTNLSAVAFRTNYLNAAKTPSPPERVPKPSGRVIRSDQGSCAQERVKAAETRSGLGVLHRFRRSVVEHGVDHGRRSLRFRD